MEKNIKNNFDSKRKGLGVASFVLGLLAITLVLFMPGICFVCAVLSLVLSVKSNISGLATAGLVLGIIGLVISSLFLCIELDIGVDTEQHLTQSENENRDDNYLQNVYGTWYLAEDHIAYGEEKYIIELVLDENNNFMWAKYGDSENNRVTGKYTIKKLDKTNYGKNAVYYEIDINGEEWYIDGELVSEPYGNTYEMGLEKTSNNAALASTRSGTLYFMKKIK